MGLLDFILQECMDWLHDAHRVVWTILMLLLLAFWAAAQPSCSWRGTGAAACSWASSP